MVGWDGVVLVEVVGVEGVVLVDDIGEVEVFVEVVRIFVFFVEVFPIEAIEFDFDEVLVDLGDFLIFSALGFDFLGCELREEVIEEEFVGELLVLAAVGFLEPAASLVFESVHFCGPYVGVPAVLVSGFKFVIYVHV